MRTVKEEGKIDHLFVTCLQSRINTYVHPFSHPNPTSRERKNIRSFIRYLLTERNTNTYFIPFSKPSPSQANAQ